MSDSPESTPHVDAKPVAPGADPGAREPAPLPPPAPEPVPAGAPMATAGVDTTGLATPADAKKKKRKPVEIAIRLNKVTKKFGAKVAVDDVSFTVKMGTVYGLIGPNGAGKTTTFSMLAGFLRPTAGQVEVLGHAPTQVDELRSRLGVLPQDALLPAQDKVGEFLRHAALLQNIPKDKAEQEARDVLTEVEGRDWYDLRCGSLSHGMAKRVALAQALLGEPDVVLLDEPTAGLDPKVAYEVRQLIKGRKKRCTMIVSSHNLQELEEVCDAAAILDRGRLVASGSISELTASSEEVHFKIGRPPPGTPAYREGVGLPLAAIRELPIVRRVEYDDERREIVCYFDRGMPDPRGGTVDAESVIEAVLWVLLNHRIRIAGVTKGRGLEQRVMELT
jgi:ABC-2 type transport system ATP-binding protein